MGNETWNEEGRIWDDDHGLLDEEQVATCARATDDPFQSPVPTKMISNGEYMPAPQTDKQKQVEARIHELAEAASRKLGMDRRRFLAGTGGMAAAFLAMNEVFGHFFNVSPLELLEPAAYAQSNTPRDLFVFDDQLHMVRADLRGLPGNARNPGGPLRAIAQGSGSPGFRSNPFNAGNLPDENGEPWGAWSPSLAGLPITPASFQIVQFIKDVYLDSQVNVGLLSNVTASLVGEGQRDVLPGERPGPRAPRSTTEAMKGEMLTAAQTAAARNFINEVSGSTRMLAHGMLYMGKANLAYIQEQIDKNSPDSWKGYNISNAAKVDNDPRSPMKQWRHDDEEIAYPTFELIDKAYAALKATKPGFNNICVHKGLAPGPPDPLRGHPADLPKAAKDWPNLNFITYHACIQPAFFMGTALQEVNAGKLRDGVPDISWTTEYAQLVAPFKNTYAEIGTTWASSVITFPTVAAHIMGQLMKYMGPDRIVFGSDSVWYGSPQWQIDALWRFQIPEEMQRKYGYPALSEDAKRKILGLNSAKLYGIHGVESSVPAGMFKPVPPDYESKMSPGFRLIMEMPAYRVDAMSKIKEHYAALGAAPSHTRYGWIRRQA
jgi:predicted TIM-barrel fold metal-dependent hydrolase